MCYLHSVTYITQEQTLECLFFHLSDYRSANQELATPLAARSFFQSLNSMLGLVIGTAM